MKKTKVVFCIPTITKPYPQLLESLEASLPFIEEAGYEHFMVSEVGNPYISAARATMLRKAMDAKADIVIFLDHDLSWDATDLLTLIETKGDVVSGTYRFKKEEEEYMGGWNTDNDGRPLLRDDGCFLANRVPAGFLKVTKEGVDKFMRAYPSLVYGEAFNPSIDLFNHGAIEGVWYGEDYAFSKRWLECGGEIALIPDMNIGHHSTTQDFPGNLHNFMLRQPGGSEAK